MGSEDFAYMLEACPGALINIGNAGAVDICPVHNPHYDFNDAALPIGASLFAPALSRAASQTCDEVAAQLIATGYRPGLAQPHSYRL
jgi:metal-dependent amidase/aminoacylase/carboxypeptidase family protein